MMKGIMGADRQRNWSELGKEGRLLILFVAQVIGCYMAHIRKTKLDREFHSLQSVLDEMRPIRYIERPNTKAAITPFVGRQIEICEAFGFDIPDGCAPEYVARKTTKGMRGRPRKKQTRGQGRGLIVQNTLKLKLLNVLWYQDSKLIRPTPSRRILQV